MPFEARSAAVFMGATGEAQKKRTGQCCGLLGHTNTAEDGHTNTAKGTSEPVLSILPP